MIISGTGHRLNKLGGYDKITFERLVELARISLKELKPDKTISGMALGWDQALTQASVDEKIPFVAAVPFKGQESIWPKESQGYYKSLLSEASEVKIVSDGGYSNKKMQIRNEWMVNNSDLVLALWNGTSGGTDNCIKYAEKKDKPIKNVWNKWLEMRSM